MKQFLSMSVVVAAKWVELETKFKRSNRALQLKFSELKKKRPTPVKALTEDASEKDSSTSPTATLDA